MEFLLSTLIAWEMTTVYIPSNLKLKTNNFKYEFHFKRKLELSLKSYMLADHIFLNCISRSNILTFISSSFNKIS